MTDDALVLVNKLASLETELLVLRTELAKLLSSDRDSLRYPSFASLEGIWAGQGNLTWKKYGLRSLDLLGTCHDHAPCAGYARGGLVPRWRSTP